MTADNKDEIHQLKEIVVTATRVETLREETSSNISVLTSDDLEELPASNVAEALQYVNGVYIEFNGGPGSQAVARIQGSEFRHVAVFQDGVPLNQVANPMTNLSYIPIDTVDRIEIYKGTASSTWGSSIGGVINIITKSPESGKPFTANVGAAYGEHKKIKNNGQISGTKDRFTYFLSMMHDQNRGFIEHADYEQDAVYAKLGCRLFSGSALNIVYSWDTGNNSDPLVNEPDFWSTIEHKRHYQRVLFDIPIRDTIYTSFEMRHHYYEFQDDDTYPDHKEIYNGYDDRTLGASSQIEWNVSNFNTLTVRCDFDQSEYNWYDHDKGRKIGYEIENLALSANDTHTKGRFSFNTGIRLDDNTDFGTAVSPSGGIVCRMLDNNIRLRLHIARGFSAPDPYWIHGIPYGNPDLKPESAMNYQLGCEVRPYRNLYGEVDFFLADIEDMIQYDSVSRKRKNIAEVLRKGVDVSMSKSFDMGLKLSFNTSLVTVEDKDTKEEIKDIPTVMHNITAAYTYKGFKQSIQGKYTDHNSSDEEETRDKVFVFDYLLTITPSFIKTSNDVELTFAVHNVFDTDYIYMDAWPKPGRWVEAGCSFKF